MYWWPKKFPFEKLPIRSVESFSWPHKVPNIGQPVSTTQMKQQNISSNKLRHDGIRIEIDDAPEIEAWTDLLSTEKSC